MVDPFPATGNGALQIDLVSRGERARLSVRRLEPLSRFIGRERELAAALDLLRAPHVRLLTLSGPGGVGKSRLALEIANAADSSLVDDLIVVPLAAIADPDLVPTAIVQELGLRDGESGDATRRVAAFIGDRRFLLVLDNFEHVWGAAGVVVDLLIACPNLKVVVTSRSMLRVSGEYGFDVLPLSLPDAEAGNSVDDVSSCDAVRLFVARAQAVRSTFELTAETAPMVAAICAWLDGLPLAIELAAARSSVLAPPAILARLTRRLPLLTSGPRDAPARQQTMRGAIAWSHDLLTADEQTLFRRLAIFTGGCAYEAVEAVMPPEPDRVSELFDLVTSLVDKNLLRPVMPAQGETDFPRFGMLETVREYAREHLEASQEAPELSDRHAAWCLAFAERAVANLAGPDAAQWARRLDDEIPNLRAGLGWLTDRRRTDDALRLAVAPWLYWMFRGRLAEGWAWLHQALELPGGDPRLRARALGVAGFLASNQGNYAFAPRVEEALSLARAAGDLTGEALALFALGDLAGDQNDHAWSMQCSEAALNLFDQIGDRTRAIMTLINLGAAARRHGDNERARAYLEEGVARARAQGFGFALAFALNLLGRIVRQQGDRARADAMYLESLETAWRLQESVGIAFILLEGASLAAFSGEAERAAHLWGAAEALRDVTGMAHEPSPAHAAGVDYARAIASARAALGDGRFAAAWEVGRNRPLADIIEAALGAGPAKPARPVAPGDERQAAYGLSPRELDILALLVAGRTDKQIADALFISWRTVQGHVSSIFRKLDVNSRTAATAVALRGKIVPEPDIRS
ncbi:MAG: hypothetical protein IT336_04670 [Thermomicrobiales bacterium]|nr:hypothetical protein [Thermomicrobiales bacterium]